MKNKAKPEIRNEFGTSLKNNQVKIILIGMDGVSPVLIEQLSQKGKLPAFKWLMDNGCYGNIKTLKPTDSPIIWSSIITGKNYKKHGIDGFIYFEIFNRVFKKTIVDKFKKIGLRRLINAMVKNGFIKTFPLSGKMIKAKTLWDIFHETGRKVGIINWWHSWPAEKINGYIVSDRVNYYRWQAKYQNPDTHEKLTYPENLYNDIQELILQPDQVGRKIIERFLDISDQEIEEMKNIHFSRHQLKSEFKYLYSLDATISGIGKYCLNKYPDTDLSVLYFRGIDIISHCAMKYMTNNDDPAISEEEKRHYGQAVPKYYQYIDEILGDFLKFLDEDTILFVVSDHGFGKDRDGEYDHKYNMPDGVIFVSGKDIKQGKKIKNASVFDIAPTVLYLSGLPVGKDMDGKVLTEFIDNKLLENNSVSYIESYGDKGTTGEIYHSSLDEDIKERLKALGYLD